MKIPPEDKDLQRTGEHRILAWWDLNIYIGAFHKRKVTARPLRVLERILGQRLHVEGWGRHRYLPEGVWSFEAYNYLDTTDPALAAYATLRQLSPLSERIGMSWQGYNTAASAITDDPDESTVCAFYLNQPDQYGLPRYRSGGVLLRLEDLSSPPYDRSERYHRSARPVVGIPAATDKPTDYRVNFTVHILCSDKQDLLSFHWPRFQESKWPDGISDFELDTRTHAGKPNIIRFQKIIRHVQEHDTVAYCLSHAPNFRIKLEIGSAFRFVGNRPANQDYYDGIVAFDMTRDA